MQLRSTVTVSRETKRNTTQVYCSQVQVTLLRSSILENEKIIHFALSCEKERETNVGGSSRCKCRSRNRAVGLRLASGCRYHLHLPLLIERKFLAEHKGVGSQDPILTARGITSVVCNSFFDEKNP